MRLVPMVGLHAVRAAKPPTKGPVPPTHTIQTQEVHLRPMMPLRGVRSSCDMVDRKSSLRWMACADGRNGGWVGKGWRRNGEGMDREWSRNGEGLEKE